MRISPYLHIVVIATSLFILVACKSTPTLELNDYENAILSLQYPSSSWELKEAQDGSSLLLDSNVDSQSALWIDTFPDRNSDISAILAEKIQEPIDTGESKEVTLLSSPEAGLFSGYASVEAEVRVDTIHRWPDVNGGEDGIFPIRHFLQLIVVDWEGQPIVITRMYSRFGSESDVAIELQAIIDSISLTGDDGL